MRKLQFSLLLVLAFLFWTGSAFASVGFKINGAMVGEATDLNFAGGSSSTDGSTGTVNMNVSTISSGTINGATIGATSPSTGKFTTLQATGLGTFTNTTATGYMNSTSATVSGIATIGSAVISGGSIDSTTVGSSTPAAGKFTTLQATSTSTLVGTGITGTLAVTGSETVSGNSTITGNSTALKFVPGVSAVVQGTPILDCSGASLWTYTPANSISVSMANAARGFYALVLTTSGTVSYTLTFSTGIKTTNPTYATGTATGKTGVINYICDGTNLIEVSRLQPPQ